MPFVIVVEETDELFAASANVDIRSFSSQFFAIFTIIVMNLGRDELNHSSNALIDLLHGMRF